MNKRLISLILAIILSFALVAVTASCNDTQQKEDESNAESSTREDETLPPPLELADDDDLSYILNSDEASYSVFGLFHETGAIRIEIPAAHDGLPVTGIVASAFSSSQYLESVFMPDTITHIGSYAFDGCPVLEDIQLSDNLLFVGDSAFEGCDELALTEYDNALYLGSDDAPYTVLIRAVDTEIESCTVHADTKFIYDYAFLECTEIDEIILPDGLISVGIYSFVDCYDLFPNNAHNNGYYLGSASNPYLVLVDTSGERDLTEFEIESSTKIIAPGAFEGCSVLSSVVIPDSVSVIGQYAFEGCSSLSSVAIGGNTWSIIDGEKAYVPVTEDSASEDIAKDLSEIYYYCIWYKQ